MGGDKLYWVAAADDHSNVNSSSSSGSSGWWSTTGGFVSPDQLSASGAIDDKLATRISGEEVVRTFQLRAIDLEEQQRDALLAQIETLGSYISFLALHSTSITSALLLFRSQH